jgi:DNA-binding NarL/FixJ family response regulator
MTIIPDYRNPCVNRHHDVYQQAEKTLRKAEILTLIAEGLTRKEIADALGISLTTLATRMNRYGIRFKRPKKVAAKEAL